ncbi:MAG: primase [Actinomycetota bacterium]|jgi:DNA primase|nr:primase [Actinomycetota bacterium]
MARIKEDDIDRLRDSADIVEVVSGYTQLKKSGGQRFVGLCPFHSEKTPSFQVDAGKGLTHCFGCGEGGNIYQFIQKVENLPFPEAVEWLARKMNYDLHYEESRPGEEQNRGLKARLILANGEASKFFHKTLMDSPDGLQARRYLEGRGFDKEVADRWQLGYAPGRDALCKYLLSKGFSEQEIMQADLGRKGEKDGQLYDFFRQRITFPTWSLQGDVVAFGARALGDQQPKYLNTSDTPVFSKSRVMYGLDRAKSSLGRGNSAVVVEGYTDVIALHEAGVPEAVATNGTALSDSHFEQLKKFTGRAVLMFDADEAGKSAAERGWGDLKQAPLFHRIGLEVLVAPLPAGQDPADVVRDDGPDAVKKVIEAARPLLEFKLEQTIDKLRLDTPEARSVAVREVARVLGWHPDPIARHEYAFSAATRIGVDAEVIQRALNENKSFDATGGAAPADRDRRLPGHVKVEREALQLLLTRPGETTPWVDRVTETNFTAPARRELFNEAKASLKSGRQPAEAVQNLSPEAVALFTELTVAAPEESTDSAIQAQEVFIRLQVFSLERDIKRLRTTLQDVNPLDDPKGHDESFTQLVGLEATRRDLLRQLRREPEEGAA